MGNKSKKSNKYKLLFEKNKRFRIVVITAGIILGIAVFSAFSSLMVHIESNDRITAAVSSEPDKLDPTFCSDVSTETILVNCFEGLMKIDENGNAVKAAASDYTVSEDGLVYTFTISPYSKWSDETEVLASDFVYAWRRTANPYNASSYAYLFENIAGYDKILEDFEKEQKGLKDEEGNYITMQMSDLWVKAADARTLVVKLKERDPSFLHKCASVGFMPLCEAKVKPFTRIWSTDPERFVSNGAFRLASWTGGSYLDLVPNAHYRDKENVSLKSMKFYFVSDGEEAKNMFDKGKVLFSGVLPEDKLVRTSKSKSYVSYENPGTYFLYFNLTEAPFDDVRVRQALTLAIDREKLIDETAETRGIAASGLISDAFSQFRQSGEEYFRTDDADENIRKAKELLAEAGYENGKGFPQFEYLFNDNTFSRETAEILAEMWKENLGITCLLRSVSWSKLEEMRNDGDFTVAKGGLMAPYNDAAYMLEKFTSSENFCGWKNGEYDKLLKQMINTQGDARNNSAHKAEKILMNDWVICPLYYYADGFLASDRIENFYVTNSGVAYFVNAKV